MDRGEYIVSGRNSVAGWFTQKDAMLFDAIDASQRAHGITGDLLEIGCYQGTSAILLGYMKQANERFIVCDLFDGVTESPEDDVERSRYYTPNFGRQMFEDNYRRFHTELPDIIGESSSILHRIGLGQTFRFIHIDGSHAYDQVRKDLLLAKELLVPGGVVAFDDITSPHTPGVQCAVWEGVIRDAFVPMWQTIKMYGTWGTPPSVLLPEGLSATHHVVYGHEMVNIEG